MCTTRMSDDPRQGVVDRDCRVHGIANLYVGGSSVFASVGYANPTYSIDQLALSLGDHIGDELRGTPGAGAGTGRGRSDPVRGSRVDAADVLPVSSDGGL
jgi:choline dehydrogenase-like flavoprotein